MEVTDITSTIQALQWLIGATLAALGALVTVVVVLYKDKDKQRKEFDAQKDVMYEKLYSLSLNNLQILEGIKDAIHTNTSELKAIPSDLKVHIDTQVTRLTELIKTHGGRPH